MDRDSAVPGDRRPGDPAPGDRGPSDDPEVSSDAAPDAAELEISAAEEVEMRRQIALQLENFEQGIEG